jgi:hypothetical protein
VQAGEADREADDDDGRTDECGDRMQACPEDDRDVAQEDVAFERTAYRADPGGQRGIARHRARPPNRGRV